MKNLKRNLVLLFIMLFVSGCGLQSNQNATTPKQKLIMAYSIYNSQYAMYMGETGYSLDADGKWAKVKSPVLSDSKRRTLIVKREILTKMYGLISLYDAMVNGTHPYSASTETALFNLIDEISRLVPE